MNEETWLACADPDAMLRGLSQFGASQRKLRLFACACARQIAPRMDDAECRPAVLLSERYADGLATSQELATLRQRYSAPRGPGARTGVIHTLCRGACYYLTYAYAADVLKGLPLLLAAVRLDDGPAKTQGGAVKCTADAARTTQCGLLRDIVGNPFRPAVRLKPAWVTETVKGIATAAYDGYAWDRLPILADALEDAGCDNGELLTHLRSGGPHARGCWALDLILGKK